MAAIALIAEQRIRESMDKGEFSELPGQGQPLDLDDGANVPPELRMAWRLLKNGGYLDDAGEKPNSADSLEDMLRGSPDERAKLRQMLKLQVVEARFSRQGGRGLNLDKDAEYQDKVVGRMSVKSGG